jgi:DNA-directed RNA polymerase subunit F
MEHVSSKPLTLEEAKEMLKRREKEGELGYEQQQALEYVEKYAKKDSEDKLKVLLKKGNISLETAVKLVDIGPKKPDTVKAILIKDNSNLTDDEIAEIVKIVS